MDRVAKMACTAELLCRRRRKDLAGECISFSAAIADEPTTISDTLKQRQMGAPRKTSLIPPNGFTNYRR